MSSAEAEIYSATSATSDAVLMFHCIKFAVGEGTTTEVASGDGQLCWTILLWKDWCWTNQAHQFTGFMGTSKKSKKVFMQVGKVSTKDNVSDLGTKRLSRDRMEYLMFLCKVYNMAESQMVGSSLADKIEEQECNEGLVSRCFKQVGMSSATSKSLMRVVFAERLELGCGYGL